MSEISELPEHPAQLAGKALIWQAIQMGGVKVIFLVRILILARLLTPGDFGLVAIATTAMGFLLNLTNFGMLPALVQGKEMDNAQYNSAWTIGLTRSIVITVIMLVGAPLIARIFAEPRAVMFVRVLAIHPLLEALSSIKLAALNRNLLFRPLALLRLADAVIHASVSIVLAIKFGIWGLVAGMLAGAATVTIGSYIIAPHHPKLSLEREAIRPLINFGRWVFTTSLIVMTGNYILRIVISRQLGAVGLGLYYLAAQLAFMPAQVASEVVGNVAFPLYARLQDNITQATRIFKAIFTSLIALLYPLCALIIVLAPSFARDVLGPNWEGTGPVIRVLTFVTMIGIFGEVVSPVLKGFGQPYRITLIELIQSTLIISMVWLLTEHFGLVGAAFAWLPAISLSQFLSASFARKILDQPFSGLQHSVIAVIITTIIAATIAGITHIFIPSLWGIVIGVILAIMSTGGMLWFSDRHFALGFMRNIAWAFPQIANYLNFPSSD